MSRASLAVLSAAAALLLPAPILGFERSIDEDCGVCFYWPQADRNVPYSVNPPGDLADGTLEGSCASSLAIDAVRRGFVAWTYASQACTDLALVDVDLASTSTFVGYRSGQVENLVVFRKGICEDVVDASDPCWAVDSDRDPTNYCDTVHNCFPAPRAENGTIVRSVIALTTVTYSPSTGQILDADMELVAWDGSGSAALPQTGTPPAGWYFTCSDRFAGDTRCAFYGDADCYSMDLQNTVAHEVGHFIGLAHPCEFQNPPAGVPFCDGGGTSVTMYPSASIGEVTKRTLEADDVAGVCTVYPAGAASPTCASSCGEESSGCGCGTASPSGLLSALLGLAALAPRLRRRRRQDTIAAA